MSRRRSLRRHLVIGLLIYTAILSAVVASHGFWVNERTEQTVWESMLRAEMAYLGQRRQQDPNFEWLNTDALRFYEKGNAPPPFGALGPGLHDELRHDDREYVALVEGMGADRKMLVLDITDQERDEITLGKSLAFSVLGVVLVMAALAYWGIGRLIRPLALLAHSIPRLSPDGRGQPLKIADSDPEEVAIVANSVNQYREHIREHVDRERTFINLASHELRTPIAVVAGSMEVALAHPDTTHLLRPHLLRAYRTSHGMEELAAMLLALARDPDRTLRDFPPVDLADELPGIIEDHDFVAKDKELSISVDIDSLPPVKAPAQVLRAVIGNLLRNAIENSDRGSIRIHSREPNTIIVEDSGHGMTEAEMAELHSRIARTGYTSTGGLGLGLISRICEHYGWELSIDSVPAGGTSASVRFINPETGELVSPGESLVDVGRWH